MKNDAPLDSVWADLAEIYRAVLDQQPSFASRLTEADKQRRCASAGLTRAILYDEIALYVARDVLDSDIKVTFCDPIVNHSGV